MNKAVITAHVIAILLASLATGQDAASAEAIPVELKRAGQGWELLRDGQPYLIRGAGGPASLERLARAGANSVRTWSADDAGEVLDAAHELGLSVTVGIWLGHERHGFDYHDEAQVRAQYQRAREAVLRYRDHPALLMWGIGNEMEGYEAGDDPAIWKAVNDIATMVQKLDPVHPTMTVTADIGGGRIASINEFCPAIDIHGINSYGGAPSLAQRYREGGGVKPYVLTEFGPPGPWETGKTEWGAPFEPNSTEKAAFYRQSYEAAVIDAAGLSLGSYVFQWGFKMEATATWFGMFLPDGSKLASVDVMTGLWSGEPPDNRAPAVGAVSIEGSNPLEPGQQVRVRADVSDPDGDPISARWVLRPESGDYVTGGDFRPMLPDVEGAILESSADGARVRMPAEPGAYRLFLYAQDDSGGAATANVPLLVKGEARTRMPVAVYEDGFEGMPWVPSGWMGSIDALSLAGDHPDNPHEGSACIKMRFAGDSPWVGVAWQHPPNNCGDQEGGYDLSGATSLELWARGEYGGERISIGVGLIGKDKAHPDSVRKKEDGIVLSKEWRQYRIPLKGADLSSIKTGFVVTISGRRGSSTTVYLDSIRFVR